MAFERRFRLERARASGGARKRRFGGPGSDLGPVQDLERLGQGTQRKHKRLQFSPPSVNANMSSSLTVSSLFDYDGDRHFFR